MEHRHATSMYQQRYVDVHSMSVSQSCLCSFLCNPYITLQFLFSCYNGDSNPYNTMYDYSLDFHVLAKKSLQVTNEEQHIVWKEYGLRLHIPCNTLPDDCSCFNLTISVSLSGNFELPEDGVLVSAVYSFTHDLGDRELRKQVTLEMQHCASVHVLKDLRVLRAVSPSYKFEVVPGGHFADGYSMIKLHHFSCFAIFFLNIRSFFFPRPFEYSARAYYLNILPSSFWVQIFITRNIEAIHTVCHIIQHIYT